MYELIKTLPYWLQMSLVILPVFSFFIAATAFAINVRQTIKNNRLYRSKIVSDCLHTFMNDEKMHNAFYKIEYNEFKYDENFHTSDQEKEIDKLLRHFSNLALMWEQGLLDLKDIYPVQYFIARTTNDPEVAKYMQFIENWIKKAKTGGHPYSSLSELAEALNEKVIK